MTDQKSFAGRIRDHATDHSTRAYATAYATSERRLPGVVEHFRTALVSPPLPNPRPTSAPGSCARRR